MSSLAAASEPQRLLRPRLSAESPPTGHLRRQDNLYIPWMPVIPRVPHHLTKEKERGTMVSVPKTLGMTRRNRGEIDTQGRA